MKLGSVTPLYASPEVFQGKVSRSSDQYSLAVCLMELLTGKLPYPPGTTAETLHAHRDGRPARLADQPPLLTELVARLLAKRPAQRPHAAPVY